MEITQENRQAVGNRIVPLLGCRYGSIRMMLVAASLMAAGYVLLSLFSGWGPWAVACCLLLPNIGFVFMQSSLSKLVTLILPREKTGAGMGVFSLTGFMSGAIGGTAATRAVDWAVSFSAIFLFFALVLVIQMGIVYFVLKGKVSRPAASVSR